MYLNIPRRKLNSFRYLSFIKNRYYLFIFLLFSLIFLLSSINIFNSLASSGIEPFLSINKTLAQYTSNYGDYLSVGGGEKGLYQIIDNWGRCQVINPTSNTPVKTVAEVGANNSRELLSKGGLNQGDSNQQGTQMDFIEQNDLNMSYLLTLVVDPSEDPTGFIKDTYDRGFLPIIRLCFDGGCAFDLSASANSIITFYEKINNNLAGTDYQFIGVVGPNEPGTGKEMTGFNVSSYATLVDRANEAASALQDYRVENGGNMYIAPAIFNLSNREMDDTKEYLNPTSHNAIDPSLYDYLLGNTYDLPNGSAVQLYEESGAKAYLESNDNLLMIFTEFGYFNGAPGGLEGLKNSYQTLCEDETVDGIMFFRPNYEILPVNIPRQDPVIPLDDIKDMVNGCDTPPTKVSKRNSSWYNCNFDSCVSNSYTYSDKSIASKVASYTPDTGNSKAWLKVKCENGECFTNQTNTMQISLPIKSLGSTTASNSARFKTFSPVCASLASLVEVNGYDPLNQFAGKLSSGNSVYPMPWLGSLISCLAQFSLSTTEYSNDLNTLDPEYHPFAKILESSVETYQDILRGLEGTVDSALDTHSVKENNAIYIPDEKTVCLKNTETNLEYCFDNDKSLDIIAAFRAYDPFATPGVYYKVQKFDGEDLIFLKNKDDFLPGPELILEEFGKQSVGGGSDMCWNFGQRTVDANVKNNFRSQRGVECQIQPFCYGAFDARGYSSSLTFNGSYYEIVKASALDKVFQSGKFSMDASYRPCFNLVYNEKINMEYSTARYSSVDSYDIEGIYDALFRSYQRLQTIMSERLFEIKFGEDIGWEVKVDSIIRDANRDKYLPTGESFSDKFGDYLYKGTDKEYNTQMCEPVEFYDNSIGKASGSNTKTRYDYYSYLGYLDVIQEWLMAYTSNSTLPSESLVENPFYNPSDSSLPNNKKEKIWVSGLANKFLSFPLQTCDEVDICKQYSNSELFNKLRSLDKFSSFTNEYIQSLANSYCPNTTRLDSNKSYTCVDSVESTRVDTLSKFLCQKGYDVGEECSVNICEVPQEDTGAVGTTLSSISQVNPNLVSLIKKVETSMCVNPGVILSMLEREITSGLPDVSGNPLEKLYPRVGNAVAWGPAQFASIAWVDSGFGKIGSNFFEGVEFSTKKCLDALGLDYTNGTFESSNVLDRTVLGYALCGAAAKLKYDSGTGDKCNNWTKEEIELAARRYLGACEQYGRAYCDIFTQTICNTYGSDNLNLCGGVITAYECSDPDGITDPNCEDGVIRLLHPLKDKAESAIVTQGYGVNLHNALDYGASTGTPVYASASGTVVGIKSNWVPCPSNATELEKLICDAGNYVKIKSVTGSKTFWSIYEHLQSVSVSIGDSVNTGELIGTTGNTGRSSGPHLHFEVRHTDCYDGYGNATLGSCSLDPSDFILSESEVVECKTTGSGSSMIKGDFACPIQDPNAPGIYIYQNSSGIAYTGNSGGSHSESLQSRYHQHEQLPTDIGAPNAIVVAPVNGVVKNVVTPLETLARYGGGICDYIRLPNGGSDDSTVNMDIVNTLSLVPCTGAGLQGKYCTTNGRFLYDPSIDDEGDFYYDGGFVVEISDAEGNLWRMVHMKDLQVEEGDSVTRGETILGRVYDGALSGEWSKYSSRDKDGSSCMSSTNPHLHFAIISANAVDNEYFAGNTIDSTPWVKEYCGLEL